MSDEQEPFGGFGGFAPEPPREESPPDATYERVPLGEYDDPHQDVPEDLHEEDVHEDLAQHPAAYAPSATSHRAERRRRGGWRPGAVFAAVVVLVVVAAIVFGGVKGYHVLKDHLSSGSGDDYAAGLASGKVSFEVTPSESGTEMGRELKAKGVVASVDAFIDAYEANPDSVHITPGTYTLEHKMTASAAVAALLNPSARVQTQVLVPEGERAADVAASLAKQTKYPAKAFLGLLHHPAQLGLPSYAGGDPEGYLFPATYEFGPKEKPLDMLRTMVEEWKQHAQADGLTTSRTIGSKTYTPQQLLTVASLVQEEGKTPSDMAKIARVVYNRIQHPGAQGQAGMLQIDATVDYGLHRPLTVGLTDADRQKDTPYNTYQHVGLPPGPIGNPGDAAIKAALHPTRGNWYYYITVNLATGETKFAHTYAQFLTYKQQHDEYCENQSASRCE